MTRYENRMKRRDFLRRSAATAACAVPLLVPRHVLGGPDQLPPSERVNVAGIGVGKTPLSQFQVGTNAVLDLVNPRDGLQLILEEPVLDASQLREVVPPRAVHQGVFVDPAYTRRVRPQRGPRLRREFSGDLAQILQHP